MEEMEFTPPEIPASKEALFGVMVETLKKQGLLTRDQCNRLIESVGCCLSEGKGEENPFKKRKNERGIHGKAH